MASLHKHLSTFSGFGSYPLVSLNSSFRVSTFLFRYEFSFCSVFISVLALPLNFKEFLISFWILTLLLVSCTIFSIKRDRSVIADLVLGGSEVGCSLFIFIISYKYFLPFISFLIIKLALYPIYLFTIPFFIIGIANLVSYLYQPYLASLLCFSFLLATQLLLVAISMSSSILAVAFPLFIYNFSLDLLRI